MADHRAALGISGIIITLYNIFWLAKFEFRWGLFTYESFFMLPVGLVLTSQFFTRNDSKPGTEQHSESTRDIDKEKSILDLLLVFLVLIVVVLGVVYFS